MGINKFIPLRESLPDIAYNLDGDSFTVVSGTHGTNNRFIRVVIKCAQGHTKDVSRSNFVNGNFRCTFCSGPSDTWEMAQEILSSNGFELISAFVKKDATGNEFIDSNKSVELKCHKGHTLEVWSYSASKTKKECPYCTGSLVTSPYSRGEEIISAILRENGIEHIREHIVIYKDERIPVDFYLPEKNIIIEYDGGHHKYKRSDSTEDQFKRIQEYDRKRDAYAKEAGIEILRVDGERVYGRAIVFWLYENLNINMGLTSLYDKIVRHVYDYSAERFGWNTYAHYKKMADLRVGGKAMAEVAVETDRSYTQINRAVTIVYGVSYSEYVNGRYNNFM